MKIFGCFVVGLALAIIAPVRADDSKCVNCHEATTPGIVAQWHDSAHAKNGVDCTACHVLPDGSPGARPHMGAGSVSPLVSPNTCGKCHPNETKEFLSSHHASAAKFIGSLDNVLGEIVEGGPAANSGCKQCHGSTVAINKNGSLAAETWPNSGIGRINPDGSSGACSACHARHSFSISQAREPDTCGKCHMGPDHPQIEIYNESKHGILFRANRDKMNMSSEKWIVGEDYSAAPTCATCHMSATKEMPVTHDIGARISWTLRPAISTKLDNWETKRESMQKVCGQCHSPGYIRNFYTQYDAVVDLYNEKFGKPATETMTALRSAKLITPTPFDEKIEWTYYMLWHHEGRRARHGAAMMGPDYTQWHGFFEVADRFYNEFLPEVKHLSPELAANLEGQEYHKWKKGLSAEQIQGVVDFYKSRYGQ